MTSTHIVLLLEGKDYEQETLAKASRLAQGMGTELTLLHLTHSSKVRRESLSLSEEERSAQGTLDAKAIISELITTLQHPVDYQCLVVDDVVSDLKHWLASHPTDLLLVGSRHHWMEGSLARLLIYKLPIDIQICLEPYVEQLKAVS
ncbi:universal stress protein [Aeromonas salmonicida]|uniref:universal stress protein n=1 Tax=Aeromonas salmonicida TaxID=645 RepID=UPI00223EE1EC|nr:universal stress protein [Aeromonas salmonicida]MDF8330233.1 universal stress protein [Aeromonas salmonicida]